MTRCLFVNAYGDRCENNASPSGYCYERHFLTKCDQCGRQATHDCSHVKYSVCGVLLCEKCGEYCSLHSERVENQSQNDKNNEESIS